MRIVDSQVHLWHDCQPTGLHRQVQTFSEYDLLKEMDEAGVDAAILCPPTFCPKTNETMPAVVRRHPSRFANWGFFALEDPASREKIKTWRKGAEQIGARFTLNLPHQKSFWTDGTIDWLWPAAEALGLPIGLAARGNLPTVGKVAERHPRLKIVIDHFAADSSKRDAEAFSEQKLLVALAKHPNIAVKVSGAPSYSTDPYPYRNIHGYIHELFDAFGPRRTMWGTDITRMPCTYRQCVTMFTEELPWLRGEDLEWVMGRALVDWLDWKLPAEAA